MTTKRDYYDVLGIARDANEKDVKAGYRKVALQFHPDRNPGDAAAEDRFKEAAEAYEILSDPEKRQVYDRYGHDAVRGNVQNANFDDILSGFGSIFEDFFGVRGFGGQGRGGRPQAQRGEDLRLELAISFLEAARGSERVIEAPRHRDCQTCKGSGAKPGTERQTCPMCRGRGQVARTQGFFSIATTCPRCRGEGSVVPEHCPDCSGEGRIEVRTPLTIKIPAGVDTGARLRLGGEGEGGRRGGPAGDLYVDLRVEPHDTFEREGNDVVLELPISMTRAALGAKLKVPTLDGEGEITVPSGAQTGDTVRLKGKGFPNLRGFGSGSQVVRFRVEVPRDLSRKQKELLHELAKTLGEE